MSHCLIALFIWGLSGLLWLSLFKTVSSGDKLQKSAPAYKDKLRFQHKKSAAVSSIMTLVAIFVIEWTFRSLGLPYTLFFCLVHLPLCLFYLMFFILSCWYNGEKEEDPQYEHQGLHANFARLTLYFGSLVVLTGDYLVFTLIWPC